MPGAGRTSSWSLSLGLDEVALCSVLRKKPWFSSPDKKLFVLDFLLTSQAAQHQAQLWHVSMVTGTVLCPQTKALRGAVVRCPRDLGYPQGWSPAAPKLLSLHTCPGTAPLTCVEHQGCRSSHPKGSVGIFSD